MTAIVVSLVAMVITILGLVVKLITFTTTIDVYVKEMRRERKVVMLVPLLEMRVGNLEQHVGLSSARHTPFVFSEQDSE